MGILSPSLVFVLNRIFLTLLSWLLAFAVINSVAVNNVSVHYASTSVREIPRRTGGQRIYRFLVLLTIAKFPSIGIVPFSLLPAILECLFSIQLCQQLSNVDTSADLLSSIPNRPYRRIPNIYVDTLHSRRYNLIPLLLSVGWPWVWLASKE